MADELEKTMTAEEGAAEADPTLGEGEAEWERPRRKAREGVVVSDRMDKTVVVVVRERKPHPLYKKVVQHRARFKAHDEDNACGVGDRVRIVETRPLSRDKRWRVAEILEKAK